MSSKVNKMKINPLKYLLYEFPKAYPTPQTYVIHWICPQCGNCISEEQSTGPISKVPPFKITKP